VDSPEMMWYFFNPRGQSYESAEQTNAD